jgi:anti-sigma regulatory factor (Ser/Thr protein kinase)
MVTVRHAPASAGEVRRRLGADLADAGVSPALIGDATLVVSELVGNAVRYATPLPGGTLQVSWTVDPQCIRLRVSDGGGVSVPVRHDAGPEDVRGRRARPGRRRADDHGLGRPPCRLAGAGRASQERPLGSSP